MPYDVTLIPGDGTGPEITEATRRVLEATGVEFNWHVRDAGLAVLEKYRHRAARRGHPVHPRDEGGPEGADHDAGGQGLPQRQRRAAQEPRPLRQPAPGQVLSRPALALREHRPHHRPREHRRPLRRHRVPARLSQRWTSWSTSSRARPGQKLSQGRRDQLQVHLRRRQPPHRQVRLRLRPRQQPPQGHGGPQGEHHEVLRRPLPPGGAGGLQGVSRHPVRGSHRRQHVHAARAEAGASTTCSCCRTSTATSSPTSRRG